MPDGLALVGVSTACLAVGVLARSIEVLANWRELPRERLLGWTRGGHDRAGAIGRLKDAAEAHPVVVGIMAVRAGAAAACLWLPFTDRATPWLLGYLVLAQAYHNRRMRSLPDNADVMFLMGLCAVFAASLDPADAQLRGVALCFVGLQALLAYLSAGVNKARSSMWRRGEFLHLTFESTSWRSDGVAELLAARPALAVAASWGVILLELALPISIFLPSTAFYVVLALGVSFHASVAVLFGLHGFFWSFVSAYPGIYFIHHRLDQAWTGLLRR